MTQSAKNKPLTHCDKYGHSWVTGTSEGFELCSHISYDNKGKASPCGATRRDPSYAPPLETFTRPVVQPSFHTLSVQQVSLFE